MAYGINTGFGNFGAADRRSTGRASRAHGPCAANVIIDEEDLEDLQYNLIRSHSAGVGDPLRVEQARML